MEHSEFAKLKAELIAGDARGLATIFQAHSQYCIGKLQHQHQCSKEDAEDLYIEAILNFREKLVNEKIDAVADLRAYLFGTCKYMLLENTRRTKRMNVATDEIAAELGESSELFDSSTAYHESLLTITEEALTATPDPCKKMLVMYYFDRMPMDQIATHLGLANANVAKASKARCFKKLVDLVRSLQLKKTSYAKVK